MLHLDKSQQPFLHSIGNDKPGLASGGDIVQRTSDHVCEIGCGKRWREKIKGAGLNSLDIKARIHNTSNHDHIHGLSRLFRT